MGKRISSYIIAFLVIITLNFMVPRMLPGDPLSAIYGNEVLIKLPSQTMEYIQSSYGLEGPL